MTRWSYFKTHHPKFDHKVSHNLAHEFQKRADSAGLLDLDVYEVQDMWTGQKELCATNHVAKGSLKDICYFQVISPTELSKIMGLKGIHSPEVLKWQNGLSFCSWCGKEGQNEGSLVNHLRTSHYHLGLICSQCLEYFTSSNTMHHHSQGCLSVHAHNNNGNNDDHEEEYDLGMAKTIMTLH